MDFLTQFGKYPIDKWPAQSVIYGTNVMTLYMKDYFKGHSVEDDLTRNLSIVGGGELKRKEGVSLSYKVDPTVILLHSHFHHSL